MSEETVKFAKLRCAPDASFWAKFAELKIDKFKLEDKIKIPLLGSHGFEEEGSVKQVLTLDYSSFNENLNDTSHKSGVPCFGYMMNSNTLEAFKQMQPENFINDLGKELLDSIQSGSALEEPWRLLLFLISSYSDLKKYKFYYWAAHPTPYNLPEMNYVKKQVFIAEEFSESQIQGLKSGFESLDPKLKCFFSATVPNEKELKILSLSDGVRLAQENQQTSEIYFAFFDPCNHTAPGWPLRNLLCLLFQHCFDFCYKNILKFISIRGKNLKNSVVYTLRAKTVSDEKVLRAELFNGKLVGWESNDRGKMGPNVADLSDVMDPVRLSERAIGLNLKLMKWRLVPDLDLDLISNLRCLLLGAGTLGCSVARVLLGWGVRTITFVDNSTVSHSNTVRQSLYTHDDAVSQKPKALAARDALLRIHPNLNAGGEILQIPMPGHVVGPSMLTSTQEAIKNLEKLFQQHDVVFLLLDSREARWLPTVLCAALDKIAINAALGFDSYTVQRHGTRTLSSNTPSDFKIQNPSGKDLGCYFCNDVTQPGNSQVDRTLDQQCTVSRPGLANIAGGLAVELMVALTQHPEKTEARALIEESGVSENKNGSSGLLGGIPHTIRGSLWNYESKLTVTHRFVSCTACSVPIVSEYKNRGIDFVLDACNQPNYLERLAGLEDLLNRPDLDELCYALDSDEEEND